MDEDEAARWKAIAGEYRASLKGLVDCLDQGMMNYPTRYAERMQAARAALAKHREMLG